MFQTVPSKDFDPNNDPGPNAKTSPFLTVMHSMFEIVALTFKYEKDSPFNVMAPKYDPKITWYVPSKTDPCITFANVLLVQVIPSGDVEHELFPAATKTPLPLEIVRYSPDVIALDVQVIPSGEVAAIPVVPPVFPTAQKTEPFHATPWYEPAGIDLLVQVIPSGEVAQVTLNALWLTATNIDPFQTTAL
jgi:hypothetical protein